MKEDWLTSEIIASAFVLHSSLGPGCFESAYKNGLYHDLRRKHIRVEFEKSFPLVYNGHVTKKGYRVDLLVERKVVVEIKAAKSIAPVDFAQIQTYLTLTGCKVGLILNFNVKYLKDGIKRVVSQKRLEQRGPL